MREKISAARLFFARLGCNRISRARADRFFKVLNEFILV